MQEKDVELQSSNISLRTNKFSDSICILKHPYKAWQKYLNKNTIMLILFSTVLPYNYQMTSLVQIF